MFHRILVGVDDTPASRAALSQAIELVAPVTAGSVSWAAHLARPWSEQRR